MSNRYVAAIVAGGRATRMDGTPKAFLQVRGRTIIDTQLACLRSVFDEVFVVANQPGRFEELGLLVVPDRVQGLGPLAGISAALAHAESFADAVFAVACDMPFIDESVIRAMITCADGESDIVIARLAGYYEPLFALYRTRCRPVIDQRLFRGDVKVSALMDAAALRVQTVSEETIRSLDPELRSFVNVNRRQDLEALAEPPNTW